MEKRKKSSGNSKKIALIGCSKTKRSNRSKAKELYQGVLFKKILRYCLTHYDKIFILSAKYGLIELDVFIEPYEETLNNKNIAEKKQWANIVLKQMKEKNILDQASNIDIYAGKNYCEFLPGNNVLKGLSIGKRLQWLNTRLKQNIRLIT